MMRMKRAAWAALNAQGPPNENIVENHLNKAFLDAF